MVKYLQMKIWVGNVTEEAGSTNELVDQMQLDIPMKKEVARWYWLMMDIVDGEFNLPEEIWREFLPEPHLKDLWQVSITLLYNTVKPAVLRRNLLFSIHRAFWTPKKLSRLRQDNMVRCMKCGSDDLHMFIDCPLLRTFWQEVGDAIKENLPTSPKVRPLMVMFGCSYEAQKMGRDGAKLLFYMMLVARREIWAYFKGLFVHCSRLSINPAQDAYDWRCPRGVHKEDDSLPRCLDDEAGTTLENPDIRVPAGTKREDGLKGGVEEDAEEQGREENAESTGDREEKADADRRHRNSVVPRGVAEQGRKEEKGDALTALHAPGGTWLTKVRSFLKDSLKINREGNDRKGEGRDNAGWGRRAAGREQGGDEEE
ncbi:hypothetical protein NDU88_006432 [Pleurodeles waltl]|uniref:Reverse transcriptase zinc-binding domain-containing protein n=1 Tax=Pleurodeles waltl TaxID=8319 RepID=A0AAV7MDW4_PLEWA|nr:hypothetical protein NDU88_006432 [Pleurodeles waltl]